MTSGSTSTAAQPGKPAAGVAQPVEPFRMRGVGRHAFVYAFGGILGKAVSFLMLPVYTRFLTPADYGVLAMIELTLDVISIIAGAQLAQGVYRYYHKANTEAERNDVVSSAFIVLGLTYAAVGTAAYFAAPALSSMLFGHAEHARLFRIASFGLFAQCLPIVPFAFARVRDFSSLVVTVNFVKLILGVGFNVLLLVYFRLGIEAILWSAFASNVLVGGWMCIWMVRRVGIRWSAAATRNLVRYGAPMIVTQFATFAATFGDRIFLNAHADSAAVGLYNLSYQFGFLLLLLGFVPFEQVWGPKRFAIARRDDRDEVLAQGFIYVNIWLVMLAVFMALFVGDVLRILTTQAFHAAAVIVPVILVAYIFQAWASIQDVGILVREKTEYVTIANWVSAAVAIGGYAVLIPRYMAWGAAAATVMAFFVRWLLTYSLSQRLWPVRYRWKPIIRLLSYGIITVVASQALPAMPLATSILAHAILAAAFVALCWWGGILTPDERRDFLATGREAGHRLHSRLRPAATPAR